MGTAPEESEGGDGVLEPHRAAVRHGLLLRWAAALRPLNKVAAATPRAELVLGEGVARDCNLICINGLDPTGLPSTDVFGITRKEERKGKGNDYVLDFFRD